LVLPCRYEQRVTSQVQPTVELLTNLDEWHPDVLLEHAIQPSDYKGGLVFRSAVESIRGTFIASSKSRREALVSDVLDGMRHVGSIAEYTETTASDRYDFEVAVHHDPDYFAAVEVKGGEGNSINISNRPLWASEFVVWCHLDGAIVNQPAHGAHSIINRVTNELVRNRKIVDALIFKDILCGTPARPCPKYPKKKASVGLRTAPDIFLLPKRVPSVEDPAPPVHDISELWLPRLILDVFEVQPKQRRVHIWEVHVEIESLSSGHLRRVVVVVHNGEQVDRSVSRSWRSGG